MKEKEGMGEMEGKYTAFLPPPSVRGE